MIEIIAGHAIDTSGTHTKVYTPADGPIMLNRELEQRWVDRGIARFVNSRQAPPEPEPTPEQTPEPPETDEDPEAVEPEGVDYSGMKLDELKDEATARGLSYPKRATRASLIKLLEDSDKPPDLAAEEVE